MDLNEAKRNVHYYGTRTFDDETHDLWLTAKWAIVEIERLTVAQKARDESADLILGICEGLMATPSLSALSNEMLIHDATASAALAAEADADGTGSRVEEVPFDKSGPCPFEYGGYEP